MKRRVYRMRNFLVFVLAAALPMAVMADQMDALVGGLRGPDGEAQAVARQLLPRHGVDAVPRLLPLLEHGNAAVRKTARNTLTDIVNEAAGPGHNAEAERCAGLLMAVVESDKPNEVKFEVLEMLATVTPEGYDVAPVAELLNEEATRERARYALQRMGTRTACAALTDALKAVEPAFQRALLDSIGKMEDPASVDAALAMTKSSDAGVRASAALALAWTGDPALASRLREVRAQATPETHFDASDALLRFADAMVLKGGNWDLAMGLYKEVLASDENPVPRAAAMMGLGRYGDETVVPALLDAAQAGDADTEAAAIEALGLLKGKAAAEAIEGVYGVFSDEAKPALLAMYGRRHDARYLPQMREALESGNPDLRVAAIAALGASGLGEALPPLVEVLEKGTEAERQQANRAVDQLADAMTAGGSSAEAGKAYVKLYNMTGNAEYRGKFLQGIARNPVPEAYDILMGTLDDEDTRAFGLRALPGLFGALVRAGEDDKAMAVFQAAQKADGSPARALEFAGQVQGVKTSIDATRLLGVVKHYYVIGPFEWDEESDWEKAFAGEPDVDLGATYAHGDQYLEWRRIEAADMTGMVDLIGVVGQVDRAFAYLYTEIALPEAMTVVMRIGSDDGYRGLVNGEQVFENRIDRGSAMDQDLVEMPLKKGKNTFLIKVSQGAGGWNYRMRLTRQDGSPAPFENALE